MVNTSTKDLHGDGGAAPRGSAPRGVRRWAPPGGCLLALALMVPAGAQGAERAWTPSERISGAVPALNQVMPDWWSPSSVTRPAVAIGAEGRALVGWRDYKAFAPPLYNANFGVMAAQGTAADGWSAPEPVSIPPDPLHPNDIVPSLETGSEASLSWNASDGRFSGFTHFRAHRLAGGGWSDAVSLTPPPGPGTWNSAAVWPGPEGTAHSVWSGLPEESTVAAAALDRAGEWSDPDVLPGDWRSTRVHWDRVGNAHVFLEKEGDQSAFTASWQAGIGWSPVHELGRTGRLEVSATGAGEVIVAWRATGYDARYWTEFRSTVRSAGGDWSPSVALDQRRVNTGSEELALAVADDGDALLVGRTQEGFMAAARPAGGEWSAMTRAPAIGQEPRHLHLNDRGEAIAVWRKDLDLRGIRCRVGAATRSAAGAWSTPQTLGDEVACKELGTGQLQAELNEAGQALVLFPQTEGGTNVLRAASVSIPEGGWSAPTTVSEPGRHALAPSLALNEDGEAVAVWEQTDNGQPFTLASTAAVFSARWTVTADPPPTPEPENLAGPEAPVAEPASAKAPAILSAYAAVRPEGRLRRASALRPGGRTFAVRVEARGSLPRGARVQVARSPARPGTIRPYGRTLLIRGERPRWARLLDAAGRSSPWRRITLDRHRPVVRLASLERVRAGMRLRIAARDDASGLRGMQLAPTRARPGPMARYRTLTAVAAGRAPRWVRVEDGMGRTSAWTAVRPLSEGPAGR